MRGDIPRARLRMKRHRGHLGSAKVWHRLFVFTGERLSHKYMRLLMRDGVVGLIDEMLSIICPLLERGLCRSSTR